MKDSAKKKSPTSQTVEGQRSWLWTGPGLAWGLGHWERRGEKKPRGLCGAGAEAEGQPQPDGGGLGLSLQYGNTSQDNSSASTATPQDLGDFLHFWLCPPFIIHKQLQAHSFLVFCRVFVFVLGGFVFVSVWFGCLLSLMTFCGKW